MTPFSLAFTTIEFNKMNYENNICVYLYSMYVQQIYNIALRYKMNNFFFVICFPTKSNFKLIYKNYF